VAFVLPGLVSALGKVMLGDFKQGESACAVECPVLWLNVALVLFRPPCRGGRCGFVR
jgi:hypothetical protein